MITVEEMLARREKICAVYFGSLDYTIKHELIYDYIVRKFNLEDRHFDVNRLDVVFTEKDGIRYELTLKSDKFNGHFVVDKLLELILNNKQFIENELSQVKKLIQDKKSLEEILDFPEFW